MERTDELVKLWDIALWEFTLAFEGLSDEDLWRRPLPPGQKTPLLSIGELAGHVAFNEAEMAGKGNVEGGESQVASCRSQRSEAKTSDLRPTTSDLQSPLVDKRFNYYTHQANNSVRLDLGVAQVLEEVKKVHEAAKAALARVKNIDETVPWRSDWTWYQCLQYRSFHLAYHCGQAYSVRHLMGHTTTDN